MRNTSFNSKPVLSRGPARGGADPESAAARSEVRVIGGRRKFISELVRRARRNFVRELWDWARCERVTGPSVKHLTESMAALDGSARVDEDSEGESPIFLLATGWRAASTLMHRILVTDPSVLLWGEPLGEMALVSEIAGMLTRLSTFPKLKEIGRAHV